MAQDKADLLKKIEFQTLKTIAFTPTDEDKVNMAQSLLNATIDTGDTILDSEMPATLFGADLDWSAGSANDLVVEISLGGASVEQDLGVEVNATPTVNTGPINYPRIVIETFSPTGVGIDSTDTYLALFDSAGDPSPETPYDDTGALASNWLSNANHNWYSRIDTNVDMGGAGLDSGTYYIKVRGNYSNKIGPYGIRVVTDTTDAYSYFGSTNPTDSPYEADNTLVSGVPTNPVTISIGDNFNRNLANSDIDWFKLVLP